MAELFWWAEDTEYCHWRIPQAGFPRRVIDDAVVHHDAIRQGSDVPAWKYYYEARNMLYFHLHVKKRVGSTPATSPSSWAGPSCASPRGGSAPVGHGPGPLRRRPGPARHPVPHRVHAGAHHLTRRALRPGPGPGRSGSPGPGRPAERLDPLGRHRPRSKMPAHMRPAHRRRTRRRPAGGAAASTSAATRCRRPRGRGGRPRGRPRTRSGSTRTQVSQ